MACSTYHIYWKNKYQKLLRNVEAKRGCWVKKQEFAFEKKYEPSKLSNFASIPEKVGQNQVLFLANGSTYHIYWRSMYLRIINDVVAEWGCWGQKARICFWKK